MQALDFMGMAGSGRRPAGHVGLERLQVISICAGLAFQKGIITYGSWAALRQRSRREGIAQLRQRP